MWSGTSNLVAQGKWHCTLGCALLRYLIGGGARISTVELHPQLHYA